MAEQSGKTLSLHGDPIWKGTYTHNGTLLKLHDYCFTTGYAKLVPVNGVKVEFGSAVWYNAANQNNTVYAAKPSSNAVFAGILARNPAIASGYPAANDEIQDFEKALLVKDGYLIYKQAYKAADDTKTLKFSDIQVGMKMYVRDTNGHITFATSAPASHTAINGTVVMLNPDDQSWTVKLSI